MARPPSTFRHSIPAFLVDTEKVLVVETGHLLNTTHSTLPTYRHYSFFAFCRSRLVQGLPDYMPVCPSTPALPSSPFLLPTSLKHRAMHTRPAVPHPAFPAYHPFTHCTCHAMLFLRHTPWFWSLVYVGFDNPRQRQEDGFGGGPYITWMADDLHSLPAFPS